MEERRHSVESTSLLANILFGVSMDIVNQKHFPISPQSRIFRCFRKCVFPWMFRNLFVKRMDTVSSLFTSAMAHWKIIAAAVVSLVVAYVLYRRFWATSTQGFTTLGGECDPQIENSCGKGAICQSDETGMKGVCFPLPEEEAASAKEEVAAIASQAEEEEMAGADSGPQEEEEESSS